MSNNWTLISHRPSVTGSLYTDEVLEPSSYAPRQSVLTTRSYVSTAAQSGIATSDESNSAHKQYRAEQWELNYREAAIYLEEGENNDKLTSHPENRAKLKYYFVTHSRWFNALILLASFCIMALGLIEGPGRPVVQISSEVCGALEIVFLTVFALELGVRCAWLGCANYVRHIRTMSKTIIVVLLYVRAIGSLAVSAGTLYWGVLRAFRPIFLLDCYYAGGTRRFVRQLLQTLPRIILMLILLGLVMFVFAVAGFYMFAEISDYSQFSTLGSSFLTVFVMMTTSNFPSAMLPAYRESKWFALYFIIYLVISIYIVMNLLFAVVYDWFTLLESTKLKKLFMHRRAACECAFRKLVRRHEPTFIPLRNFEGLLRFYSPSMRCIDVYLAYKALLSKVRPATDSHICCTPACTSAHADETTSVDSETDEAETEPHNQPGERLTLEMFYDVYEVTKLAWRTRRSETIWHERLNSERLRSVFKVLRTVAESSAFDWTINALIIANCAFVVAETVDYSHHLTELRNFDTIWVSLAFSLLYAVELLTKLLALGTWRFFVSPWNKYDLSIVIVIWLATLLEMIDSWLFTGVNILPFSLVLILRPLRLVRLLRSFELYREIVGTLKVLRPRMLSALVVICVVYYFFGVIGNEVFGQVVLINCCKNSSFADNYRADNSTDDQGLYFLLTFENAVSACVTLFHLTIVNDWYITMNGYAIVTGSEWTRVYFAAFYLVMMVVLSMIVSFILDAFVFRMRYSRSALDMNHDTIERVEVSVSLAEREMCASAEEHGAPLTLVRTLRNNNDGSMVDSEHNQDHESLVCFIGERPREPFDFSLQMHADEVRIWQREADSRMRNRDFRANTRRISAANSSGPALSNHASIPVQTVFGRLQSLASVLRSRIANFFHLPDRLDGLNQPLDQPDTDSLNHYNVSNNMSEPTALVEVEASYHVDGGDPLRSAAAHEIFTSPSVSRLPMGMVQSYENSAMTEIDSHDHEAPLQDSPSLDARSSRKTGFIQLLDEDGSERENNFQAAVTENIECSSQNARKLTISHNHSEHGDAAGVSVDAPSTLPGTPPLLSSSLQQFTSIEMAVKEVKSESALKKD